MTDDQPQKPPSLPEPPPSPDDTNPTETGSDTQPTAPAIIPPPPGTVRPSTSAPPQLRARRRRNQTSAWLGAVGIAALLGLIVVLLFVVLFLLFAPPDYVDPWIPGRLATRTVQAAQAEQTAAAFATGEADLAATGTAAAADLARRETLAAESAAQAVTRGALELAGTAAALERAATSDAQDLDATRTAAALAAQQTAAAGTLAAIDTLFTQTAVANVAAAPTGIPNTPNAPTPTGREAGAAALPTISTTFDTFFADDFDNGFNPAWSFDPSWEIANGQAFTTVCGASMTIGPRDWSGFAVEVDVDSPGAQVALTLGYGEAGTLYINFGLNGAIWWLVEDAALIDTDLTADLYDPTVVNRVRIVADERVVAVRVNGVVVAERLLPEPVSGPVGLYACPANRVIPAFDNLRVLRLED